MASDTSSSSMSHSAVDDGTNPFFIHHSDSPDLVLVFQSLTGENYASWSRSMTIALSEKNKLGFVNGTIMRPSGDVNLLNAWIRSNNMVISWILNSVSKEISESLIDSDSAFGIWNDLKERFQQSNGPRIFQLRRELMNLNQGELSVSAYYTRLKTVWDELSNFRPMCSCTCGGTKALMDYNHMEYVMSFLMGLNDSYAQICGQILLMEPLPPINKVFALVSQEENQRAVMNTNGTDSTLFSIKHKANRPNFGRPQRKDRPMCTHCGYSGHTIEKCYKLHGFPPGYRSRQRNNVNQARSNQTNFAIINQVQDNHPRRDLQDETFQVINMGGGSGMRGSSRFGGGIFGDNIFSSFGDDFFSSGMFGDDFFSGGMFGKGRPTSSALRKAPPIENTLPCSLEELYKGTTKKMKVSRELVDARGKTLPVEEILTIDIKPGWKKGTKITFPEKGNGQPNVVPADLVFIIGEKPHNVFTRDGNDLVVTQKISRAEALTGYSVHLTTLDGRNLTIPISNVIHPSYEEVVPREGMPLPKDPSKKGNLRIKFNIKFPGEVDGGAEVRDQETAGAMRKMHG